MAVESSMRSTRASSVVSDDDELYAGDSELNTSATDLLRIINNSTKSVQSMMTKGASAGNISVGKHIDDLAHAVKLLESVGLQSQFDLRNCDGPDTDCDDCREALTKVWDPRSNINDNDDDESVIEAESAARPSQQSERQSFGNGYAVPIKQAQFSDNPTVHYGPPTHDTEAQYGRDRNPMPPPPSSRPEMSTRPVSQSQPPVEYTDYGVPASRGPKPRSNLSEVPGPTIRQSESSARTDTKVRFSQSSRMPPPPPPEWSDQQRSNLSNRSFTTRGPHNLSTGTANRDGAGGPVNDHSRFGGRRSENWSNHNTSPIRV